MRPKITYANVVATLALLIALGGSSYAALKLPKNSVGPKQLKKNAVSTSKVKKEAITAAKVKKGTLTGSQISLSTLGTVPAAQTASVASVANSVAPSEGWHMIGAAGEPTFQNGWQNAGGTVDRVGFYKDRTGIVHLTGRAFAGPSNNTMFQLPHGYRPAAGGSLSFAVACQCTYTAIDPQGGFVTISLPTGRVFVDGSGSGPNLEGRVTLENGGSGATVNLDGITFRAES